jgi:hypothetical protein
MSALLACIEVIEEQLRRRSVEEQLRSLGQWPPPTQDIVASHVIDPDAVLADQKQRRQLANERRKQEAQLTPEQRDTIAAYFERNKTASDAQAADYFMPVYGWSKRTARRKIKLAKPYTKSH